ncbi:AAA family ATPase [Chromobacterium alkanivorans]|uniref:AAA family ATPase n=1 Tax=Chromobacterium alkanivorans TaxID=1071719 RepID=UPI001966FA86|nr:AAA family ATPase [Chromobacterium alkanivorans]MBN3003076.1 AAA family ATPase [Chromobacterium alkanivorans]
MNWPSIHGLKEGRLFEMYKLGRLSVQNFKSIKDQLEVNLKNVRAAIFDGPNGFGKTTIFDSIEICFTGKISRITSSKIAQDNKAREGHLLKNMHDKPTVIKLELLSENSDEDLVIVAEIKSNIKGSAASVRRYEEHIVRYFTNNWDSDERSSLDEAVLASKLDMTDLPSLFPVQHYISQEDTAHFLKDRSESDRHEQLSHLFGTTNQSNELASFEKIKSKLISKRDALKLKNDEKNALLQKMMSSERSEEASASNPSGEIKFISNLTGKENDFASLDASLSALQNILPAIESPVIYQSMRYNGLLDVIETSREQELDDFIKFGGLSDFKEIERLYRAKRRWGVHSEKLKTYREARKEIEDDAQEINDNLLIYLQRYFSLTERVFSEIKNLASLRNKSSTFSRIRSQLLNHREALIKAYKSYHAENHLDNTACPLCGDEKIDGIDQLINEYGRQQEFYENQSSASDKEVAICSAYLKENYVEKIVARIDRYIAKASWIEEQEVLRFFKEKSIDEKRFNKMCKLRDWLSGQEVIWDDLIDGSLFSLSNEYAEKKSKLKERVRRLRKTIPISDIHIDLDKIKEGCTVLDIKNDDALFCIAHESILTDISYVKSELVKLHGNEVKMLNDELVLIGEQLESCLQKITSLDSIVRIYSDSIKRYEIDVASSIAIPFYVYSSKVLQTRLDGTGIFLKTPTEGGRERNPYIRFCARKKDSHDAWCTMSSGQLAGLVISFALAMNKLYPSKLEMMLIDDPVQSMDEINAASLIQLFLYEFPRYQFVVSTHEQKIASYMSYKFLQGGGRVNRFNMKNITNN